MNLTVAWVNRRLAGPSPKQDMYVTDTTLPRFFLLLRPAPGPDAPFPARYCIQYGRQNRRLRVGDARLIPLDAARSAARVLLANIDLGGDPVAERQQAHEEWTCRELFAAYVVSREFADKSALTKPRVAGLIRLHLDHRIGARKLGEINIPLGRRLLREIEDDRRTTTTGRALGGPGTARKALHILKAILGWAVNEGRLATNPLAGLRIGSDGVRETILEDAADYVKLFAALDRGVAEGWLRESVRACIVLICSTGLRRTEATDLRWRSIDLATGRIELRDTKGVRLRRGGPRREFVGLPPAACEILSHLRPEDADDDDLVFTPRGGATRITIAHDFRRVVREAGLPHGLCLHSLRHSIGSHGAAQGLSAHELQALLRHRDARTVGRYIHWSERQQQALAVRAIAHMLPTPAAPAADVVPLPGRRRGR
jgi:integrase